MLIIYLDNIKINNHVLLSCFYINKLNQFFNYEISSFLLLIKCYKKQQNKGVNGQINFYHNLTRVFSVILFVDFYEIKLRYLVVSNQN